MQNQIYLSYAEAPPIFAFALQTIFNANAKLQNKFDMKGDVSFFLVRDGG